MTIDDMLDYDEPCFVISVAARMIGVRTQTLRYYERQGLIEPQRTGGRQRIFSRRDVDRIRRIRHYMDEWGVNLAGVEVVLKLMDRVQKAEAAVERLAAENERLGRELVAARSV
jgi:MerR family transcriptional regulator/heat shock protein HspR